MSSNNLRPTRDTVVISGYYGFNNLGDEAILEQLIAELRFLTPGCRIVVLSNNPNHTSSTYGVLSVSRWNLMALLKTLPRCRLFISGGGGLFQDMQSIKSVVYYGAHILLARAYKCFVVIYAQGLGPLNLAISRWFTRCVFKQANAISVRDDVSEKTLIQWGIRSTRSADPVWCLQSNSLPSRIEEQLKQAGLSSKQPGRLRVGVCLREFTSQSLDLRTALLKTVAAALPVGSLILPLILQPLKDKTITDDLKRHLLSYGHEVIEIDYTKLSLPSQWLGLFSHCDLVISMRLHALIMALKMGVPVVGLAYDPKVIRVLQDFDQPCINLLNHKQSNFEEEIEKLWPATFKFGLENTEELGRRATTHAAAAQTLAKQNFELLATIIPREMPGVSA